ncbi:MAG: NADH-dependent [FeFe] hydrogenase, group A6 [Christensenellales bacterium]|jgi:NADP-reducing hydrogenase subunit HndD
MAKITLTIDGRQVEVDKGTTVLEAARAANVHIPTLCYLKNVSSLGACRMCVVQIEGMRNMPASCVLAAADGMVVKTNTPAIREARRVNLELLLSDHDRRCLTCVRNKNCELQTLCEELGVEEIEFEGDRPERKKDSTSSAIVRDNNKCILCRRCVSVCAQMQNVGVIGAQERGFKTEIGQAFDIPLGTSTCINCGQCIIACPTGALREKSSIDDVWAALNDPNKHVVVQPAPAVRATLGEPFGMPMGTRVTGKMAAALRRLGFDKIFDTDFGADLTIMEEGAEFIHRLQNGGVLPMITSCSPGWIKFCEHFYPDFIDNLSTCKSPHQMLGAVIKSYYAKEHGYDPKDIYTVSIMPCTAKKFEAQRPEMTATGYPDVDAVLTTRELATMIKQARIDFANLEDEPFDDMLGDSSGAADIFGATGGVMEAALRTVAHVLTGGSVDKVDFHEVRGIAGVKEATIKVGDLDVNVAVASSTGAASRLLDAVRAGKKNYHFIEIMGCPGGCVNGGGQPIISASTRMDIDPRVVRAKALYTEDENKPVRRSHENPSLQKLYEEFLGEPNSHKSHELLHTHYTKRGKYDIHED